MIGIRAGKVTQLLRKMTRLEHRHGGAPCAIASPRFVPVLAVIQAKAWLC
jgi:hypothetical protein